jgi:hypothetical protein
LYRSPCHANLSAFRLRRKGGLTPAGCPPLDCFCSVLTSPASRFRPGCDLSPRPYP